MCERTDDILRRTHTLAETFWLCQLVLISKIRKSIEFNYTRVELDISHRISDVHVRPRHGRLLRDIMCTYSVAYIIIIIIVQLSLRPYA